MKQLELPITLHLAKLDEIPQKSKYNKTARNKIVEGFKIIDSNNTEFNFYAEININNSNLWNLFNNLCDELPNEVSLIFKNVDCDPNYGYYTDKITTLEFLHSYKEEIVSDTFLELGLIFHSNNILIEIFITESKYIQFWGVDKDSFLKTMKDFNLHEIEGLEFIDEYPNVRKPLKFFKENILETNELISILKSKFG